MISVLAFVRGQKIACYLIVLKFFIILLTVEAFTKDRWTQFDRCIGRCISSLHSIQAADQFEQWWQDQNVKTADVKQAIFELDNGRTRGLSTTRAVEDNALVVALPKDLTITVLDKGISDSPPEFKQIWASLKPTTRVSCLLLLEYLKGGASKFAGYVENLPQPGELKTPIHWDANILDSIPYEQLKVSVEEQRSTWQALYKQVCDPNILGGLVDWERFVWAMESVISRAFEGEGPTNLLKSIGPIISGLAIVGISSSQLFHLSSIQLGILLGSIAALLIVPDKGSQKSRTCTLLPVIDSSNHRSSSFNCILMQEPILGAFTLRARRPIAAFEEITISYGNRDNDQLLQYFGFVESNNENDRFVILDPIATLELELKLNSSVLNNPQLVSSLQEVLVDLKFRENLGGEWRKNRLIIRRGMVESYRLGALSKLLEDSRVPQSIDTTKTVLHVLVFSALRNLKDHLSSRSKATYSNEVEFLIQSFLQEKVKTLEVALNQLKSAETISD